MLRWIGVIVAGLVLALGARGVAQDEGLECLPAPRPLVIDGELEDWEGIPFRPVRTVPEPPRAEIAGEFAFSYTQDALHLAGRVVDDQLLPDLLPAGEIEDSTVVLYLDLAPDSAEDEAFDEDDVHLLLRPLRRERPWDVLFWRGETDPGSLQLSGLAVVSTVGEAGDWQFEAKLPWASLGLYPDQHRLLGVELQLRDRDQPTADSQDLLGPESYQLNLGGIAGGITDPAQLRPLELVGRAPDFTPEPDRPSTRRVVFGVLAVLALLGVLSLVGTSSQRIHQMLRPKVAHWRGWTLGLLGVGGLALFFGPNIWESWRVWRLEAEVEERSAALEGVFEKFRRDPTLGKRLRGADHVVVRDLLEGTSYRPQGSYRFVQAKVGEARAIHDYRSRVEGEPVPFVEQGILVEDPSPLADVDGTVEPPPIELRLVTPVPANRVHLSVACLLPEGVAEIDDGLRVDFQFDSYTDASYETFPLRDTASSRILLPADPRVLGPAHVRGGFRGPWSDSRLALSVGGRDLVHLDHLVYEVPDNFHSTSPARLVSMRVRKTAAAAGAVVWISGVTAESGLSTLHYEPLLFGSNDRDGFPVALRPGAAAAQEVRVLAGQEVPVEMPEDSELQRLRIYFRPDRVSPFETEPPIEGRARALVEVEVKGKESAVVFPLRTSLEVAEEVPPDGRLPDTYASFVVASFESPTGRQHYTGYELPLAAELGPGPYELESMKVRVPEGAGAGFRVVGVTAALGVMPDPPPEGSPLVDDERGGLVLASEVVQLLRDGSARGGFAIVESGRVQSLSSSTDAELATLLQGTAAAEDSGEPVAVAGEARRVARSDRVLVESTVALPFSEGQWSLRLWSELEGRGELERARDITALGLGVLSLPLVLLVLVDVLRQMTRIRSRLSLLFLVISAVPLSVMFLILVQVVVKDQEADEQARTQAALQGARQSIDRLQESAAATAAQVHREFASGPLLRDPGANAEELRRLLAVKTEEMDAPGRVQIRATVHPTGGEAEALFLYSSPQGRHDRRWLAVRDGVSLCGGELVVSGSRSTNELTIQVAGVLSDPDWELPFLEEGEAVALLSPRLVMDTPGEGGDGIPIEGGTVLAKAGDGGLAIQRREAEEVARLLDTGQGRIRRSNPEQGTRTYDLLRSDGGEPVAVLMAQVQSSALMVDLAGFRVELLWLVLVLGAVTLACSLFLGSVVTEGITQPLVRLQQGARTLADGGEAVLVEEQGDDEVSELASSFNRMSEELQRRSRSQGMMSAATAVLTRTLELSERVGVALDFLLEAIPSRSMACYLYASGRDELALEGFRIAGQQAASPPPPRIRHPDGPLRTVLHEGEPVHLARGSDSPRWDEASAEERAALGGGERPLLFLPLGRSGRLTGVVVVHCESESPLEGIDPEFLRNLLAQFSVALENARLYRLAIEDHETGAFVHSYFAGRVGEAIDADEGGGLALLAILGSWPVDAAVSPQERRQAAIRLARDLQRLGRDAELVARRESLEFEVLIPTGGVERAEEIAERVGELWQAEVLQLSTAVVEYPEHGRSSEFLLDALRDRLSSAGSRGESEEIWERMARRAPEFVFKAERMIPVLRQVERVASSDATALIVGETGTGKEVIAQLVHRLSARREAPFVAVHCAALPEALLEAELFGYEKGAFTGADRRKPGRFEMAQHGTLFLDEVAEIPLPVQVKLLRVLQERRIQRLGGEGEIEVDVRVLAATHRSLEKMVEAGSFREDLYYRLQVVTVEVPPLRERWEEVPTLVERFIEEHRSKKGARPVVGIEPAALDLLRRHDWPGNIRELRNVIQRALVLGQQERIQPGDIEWSGSGSKGTGRGSPSARAGRDPSSKRSGGGPRRSERSGAPRGPVGPVEEAAPASDPELLEAEELNPRQRQLLELLASQPTVTSRELVDRTGVSRRTALRDIQELMQRGLVLREGTRKAAVYRLR